MIVCDWLLALSIRFFKIRLLLQHVSMSHSFLFPNIPLYRYFNGLSTSHQLMDIWIVSTFWLLWFICFHSFTYLHSFTHMFAFLWSRQTGVGFFSWKVDLCLESTLDYQRFTSHCAHGLVSDSFAYGFSLCLQPGKLRVERELINVYIAPSIEWRLVQGAGVLSDQVTLWSMVVDPKPNELNCLRSHHLCKSTKFILGLGKNFSSFWKPFMVNLFLLKLQQSALFGICGTGLGKRISVPVSFFFFFFFQKRGGCYFRI